MSVSAVCSDKLFSDFPFIPTIFEDLAAAGYERPTPIQAECLGPALEGRDLIGLAETGTGKTAVFALPIIQRLAHRLELGALVLAPTRELAFQIADFFDKLGRSSGIRVATIVGGVPMDHDTKAMRSWPSVIVATPGRLIDHLGGGRLSLKEVEVLVIDEADRMHDMGFMPQIQEILRHLPVERQTMMFTATMPREVERVARRHLRDPLRVQIGQTAPAHGARQQIFELADDQKMPLLLELLAGGDGGRVLIFLRTKIGVDRLGRTLQRHGVRTARLHGDREQCDRDEAMNGFRSGKHRILIATDIAARGLDVADIEHVINYDFPRQPEDYVHRIGRTARLEATGLATSFVTPPDRRLLAGVRRLIGDKLPKSVSLGKGPGAVEAVSAGAEELEQAVASASHAEHPVGAAGTPGVARAPHKPQGHRTGEPHGHRPAEAHGARLVDPQAKEAGSRKRRRRRGGRGGRGRSGPDAGRPESPVSAPADGAGL